MIIASANVGKATLPRAAKEIDRLLRGPPSAPRCYDAGTRPGEALKQIFASGHRSGSGGGGNPAPAHSELSVVPSRSDRHLHRSGGTRRAILMLLLTGSTLNLEISWARLWLWRRRCKRDSVGHLRGTKSPERRDPVRRTRGRGGTLAARLMTSLAMIAE